MFARHPSAGLQYIPNRPNTPPAPTQPPAGGPPPGAMQPPAGGPPPGAMPPPAPERQYAPNQFAGPPPGGPPMGGPGGPPGPGGPMGPVVAQPPAMTGNAKRDRRLQEIFQMQNFINNRTAPGQAPMDLADKYKKARKQFRQYMNGPQGALNGRIEAEQGPPRMTAPMQNQMMNPMLRQQIQAQQLRGLGGGGGMGSMMQMQEL